LDIGADKFNPKVVAHVETLEIKREPVFGRRLDELHPTPKMKNDSEYSHKQTNAFDS